MSLMIILENEDFIFLKLKSETFTKVFQNLEKALSDSKIWKWEFFETSIKRQLILNKLAWL